MVDGPAVFVHGNPETAAIWDPLLAELGREDTVRLSPPGFGAPLPPGFDASPAGYRAWLVGELEGIGTAVDIVGHDWGGAHVVGVAMQRPDLLRSWVSDAVGAYHSDYEWHELAQVWQDPERGERHAAGLVVERESAVGRLAGRGVPRMVAEQVVDGYDPTLPQAIVALYRAAAQPVMARLGEHLERAAAVPGLVVLATADDAVGTREQRREAAQRAGAQVAVLEDLGHWWLAEDPIAAAAVLRGFWNRLVR